MDNIKNVNNCITVIYHRHEYFDLIHEDMHWIHVAQEKFQ
jgi:hypothetical protein